MSEHTPGPDEVRRLMNCERGLAAAIDWLITNEPAVLARLQEEAWSPSEHDPEAYLTRAAAPDLLEALEEAVSDMDKPLWWVGHKRFPCCGAVADGGAHHETCWTHRARAALAKAKGDDR